MLNVHFNGEIVRCPDQKANYIRLLQTRETKRFCCFGVPEDLCKTYHQYLMIDPKNRLNKGCCRLSGVYTEQIIDGISCKHYSCPRAQKRYLAAISPKKFKIDNTVYRKLSSAAHWMIKESEHKTIFLTLTFPNFKKNEITEKQANKCFSKFAENLKETYSCNHYIAVRERGEKHNRLHFHLIISMPFVHFSKLNSAWCSCIQDYCDFSNSAIQSRAGERVIRNPIRAIRYVCKYMAKTKGSESDSRLYFISNNTLKKAISLRGVAFNLSEVTEKFKSLQVKKFDYCTRFRITDRKEFNQFCNDFLYPLFECSVNWSSLYFDPDNST